MEFDEFHIDIRKLRDYCLNPNHPVGKHKARVFASQLGIHRREAEILKEKILREINDAELVPTFEDQFGKRFSADLGVNINNRFALVRTIWILKSGRNIPELVTCYIII